MRIKEKHKNEIRRRMYSAALRNENLVVRIDDEKHMIRFNQMNQQFIHENVEMMMAWLNEQLEREDIINVQIKVKKS